VQARPINRALSLLTGTSIVAATACARLHASQSTAVAPAAVPTPTQARPARATREEPTGRYEWRMHGRVKYPWLDGAESSHEAMGTMDVFRFDGEYGASITTSGGLVVATRWAGIEGNDITVIADTPHGELRLLLSLRGDSIPAAWSLSGGTAGEFTGRLSVTRQR
jgi:hypothetical protein